MQDLRKPDVGKTIRFLVASLVFLSFFLIRADSLLNRITESPQGNTVIDLNDDVVIKQDIPQNISDISSIQILFTTYGKVCEGIVDVCLYENDGLMEKWSYDASDISDNSFTEFELEHRLHLTDNNDYYFSIEYHSTDENPIAVWVSGTDAGNDTCYRLIIPDIQLKITVSLIAVFVLSALIIMFALRVDERVIMTSLLIALMAAFLMVCPPGTSTDECPHFYRAYEIAHGYLLSDNYGELGGGNVLPRALMMFADQNAVIDWEDTAEILFPTMSLYAPVSYIPQAIGIAITELFTKKVSFIFLGGRIGGALFCLALSVAAIWLIPYGKKILYMVILFPLTLQEMISMAPDGFTISLALFLFAYILYVSGKEGDIRKRDIAVILTTCLVLSLCKIVYVVLVLLVLLIPKEKYKSKINMYAFVGSVIAISAILNLIWLKISSSYFIEFRPGVDSLAQVKGVLKDPLYYCKVVVNTLYDFGEFYVSTMIGSSMGALTIVITPIAWLSYLVLLVSEIAGNRERFTCIRKNDKLILFFVFLACSALIFTSLYVQWTELGNDRIMGIQGRYFTPLIPVLAFGIMHCIRERDPQDVNMHPKASRGSYYYIILSFLNGITLIDMISYYINT